MRTGKDLLCFRESKSKHCRIESIVSILADDSVVAINFCFVLLDLCFSATPTCHLYHDNQLNEDERMVVALFSPFRLPTFLHFFFLDPKVVLRLMTVVFSGHSFILIFSFHFAVSTSTQNEVKMQ